MRPLLIESNQPILYDYIHHFASYACERLGIQWCPPITIKSKTGTSSFGSYNTTDKRIIVAVDGRHIADILRTLAHELVHDAQHKNGIPSASLEELEYEANAVAGMIMREYNKLRPELYDAEGQNQDDDEYGEGLADAQPMRPSHPVTMAEVVNSVGSGGVDGIGVGPRGEPGIPRGKRPQILKRKTLSQFKHGIKQDTV